MHTIQRHRPGRAAITAIAALALAASCALAAPGTADAHSGHTRSWSGSTDLTRLQLGNGKVSTTGPRRGWVYACQSGRGGGTRWRPWVSGSTWSWVEKPKVQGTVRWSQASIRIRRSGSERTITGNGLPRHATGSFPISSSDPAYQYDRNPNSIGQTRIDLELPATPSFASTPGCLPNGPIGVMTSGVAIFNALDADGNDAPATELQDRCSGHPAPRGTYHYHSLTNCIASGKAGQHSRVIGWALDGFPITGPRGANGVTMTNGRLDACHGHRHALIIGGRRTVTYHYHATMQYPYTLGCFRGTSVLAGAR